MQQYSSIQLLRNAFVVKGYTLEQFELGKHDFTRFIAPNGDSWSTPDMRIAYPYLPEAARAMSHNKDKAYTYAKNQGVTIPDTFVIQNGEITETEIASYLRAAPLIVKPNDSTLSRGLSMNITNADELVRCIQLASLFSDTVLVQRQMRGEEIRFAVVEGTVVAAILRQRLRVKGDGVQTVAQLVTAENEIRLKLDTTQVKYPQITGDIVAIEPELLARIPTIGEVVVLGENSMLKRGSSLYNVTDKIHQSYKDIARKLGEPFGVGFVVVDMLVEDYSQPYTTSNCTFMEFNMAPVLNHFYSCRDGNQYDILEDLVTMIDTSLKGAVV
jgi:glutamate--cysteine ligase